MKVFLFAFGLVASMATEKMLLFLKIIFAMNVMVKMVLMQILNRKVAIGAPIALMNLNSTKKNINVLLVSHLNVL